MESFFRTKSIFDLIIKWKWHILVICVIAAALGVLISSPMVMTPKFKSNAILYPANIYTFSEESETEQMLEVINSADIRAQIVESFNLAEHYDIAKDYKYYLSTINFEYSKNIKFTKTPNQAIKITVLDKDPQVACNIADSLIFFFNRKMKELEFNKAYETAVVFQNAYNEKNNEIDSLSNLIVKIRDDYNLLDYKSQVRAYSEAIAEGKNVKQNKELLANWEQKGTEYARLDSLLNNSLQNLNEYKKQYDIAIRNKNRDITYSHVIEKPFVSDKKAYPVRWLILLLTVIGAFFASVITISIIESVKNKN